MFQRLLMVVTKRFEQLRIRQQRQHCLCRPRFRIRLRIVDRDRQFHAPEVDAPEPFRDVQCVAVRVGLPRIEPAAIPQADRVDNKRVAIPSTDRVPKPRRLGILRQRTSVGEHLAEHEADLRFVQEDGLGRRLDDLELID